MRRTWILAAVVVLAAAAWLVTRVERGEPLHELGEASERKEEADAAPARLRDAPASDARAVEAKEERALVEPAAQPSPAPDPKLCEIRGRFVLPGGAPAVGATYEIHGWRSNEEAVRRYGLPERWDDLVGETDADGRLSERFEPPRAYQFTLEVKMPGLAGAEWRRGEMLAGTVVDVGEVELVRGGAVEGRIVDAEGNAVAGQWMVHARSVGRRERDGRDETQVMQSANADGSFRLEEVMTGRVELEANGDDWTEASIFQVRAGETTTADIVTRTLEASARITLDAAWKRLSALGAEPEHVTLIGPDGAGLKPTDSHAAFGHIVFEDLAPGEYQLTIDDPRFRPWSRTAEPGEDVEAELEGTSAFLLDVRDAVEVREATLQFLDAQSGAPLARQTISLLGPPGHWYEGYPWQRKKTDAQGKASWTLAVGEYRFRLDPESDDFFFFPEEEDPAHPARITPITLTAEGPLVREVRL